jgi:hypothetical protein
MPTDNDRDTIGLTPGNAEIVREIESRGWFSDGQDIARFCLAFAIRSGAPAGTTNGTETRWAAGNFDRAGEIRALLAALYPSCKTPVRLMEHLVNQGLHLVGTRLQAPSTSGPRDLFD